MKIIVTGGAGFIGSNLLRYLHQQGEHELLNIDKLCFPGSRHTISEFESVDNYRHVASDIVDQSQIMKLFAEFKPDAVFHLAAESHVDRSIDSPGSFIESNIQGTYSLLEAFRHYYSGLDEKQRLHKKFIHVSTDEVYGSLEPEQAAFTEHNAYHPNSPYAASKAASDHLVTSWGHTYQLPLVITNCSNNYGPYQFPEKLIPLVISKAISDEPIPVYGKGDNVRDWLHVEDHVRALVKVQEKGIPGESYNIGARNEVSNIELVQQICDIVDDIHPGNTSKRDLIQFVQDRPGHDFRYAIDNRKITNELDWHPQEEFETGLRHTVSWYLDNQQWCQNVCEGSYDGERLGVSTK